MTRTTCRSSAFAAPVRASRSGARRPTTTGSAGWPSAGTAWGVAELTRAGRRRHRATSDGVVDPRAVPDVRGHRDPAPHAASRATRDGAITRRGDGDHPGRAERPGPRRHGPRARRRARTGDLVRARAARVVPRPEARRAARHAGARPSTSSTCRTCGRRRTAATPTSAGWSSRDASGNGYRIDLDAAAPGERRPVPRRRPLRRDPRRRAAAARRDDRPPRCRAPGRRHGQLRPGHAARQYIVPTGEISWTWSITPIRAGA